MKISQHKSGTHNFRLCENLETQNLTKKIDGFDGSFGARRYDNRIVEQ